MLALGLALGCSIGAGPAAAQEAVASYDIEGRSLADALRDFGRISNTQIIFDEALVRGRTAPTLRGDYPASQALDILLAGSGLRAERTRNGATMIVDGSWRPQGRADAAPFSDGLGSETIIVTGTRIRNASPASPVRVVGREEIDRTGYSQLSDVMRSLPENYSGGSNPGVLGNSNVTNASMINLRGIGPDASLALVNGRRLAADVLYNASDISGIPLSAIRRIEVVTDGSSAVYGSDAIAGVANFILVDDFDGVEVAGRVGTTTEGGGTEQTYSVLGGLSRPNWHLLLSGEYSRQEGIEAGQRDFTSAAASHVTLVRPQERTSFFLSGGVDLTEGVRLSLDALASERSASHTTQSGGPTTRFDLTGTTPAHSIAIGLDFALSDRWQLNLSAVNSRSEFDGTARSTTTFSRTQSENEITYAEGAIEGSLFALPSGAVRVAVGGGHRREEYRRDDGVVVAGSRDVNYAFGELQVPLVTESSSRAGLHALDLNISGRYEDYSDFGSTATPKVGLRYVPAEGLTLRTTWGESFKAPTFQQALSSQTVALYPGSIFALPAGQTVLYRTGGNPDLEPERATSWTLGVDYAPPAISGLRLSATYFNIDYRDRVVQPILSPLQALSESIYSSFVVNNPSSTLQADVVSNAQFFNVSGGPYDPAAVAALINNQDANAAAMAASGVDLGYRQRFAFGAGELDLFANATWIDVSQQLLAGLPEIGVSGNIGNIPEFRARVGGTWVVGAFSATGVVNYVDEFSDTGMTPNRPINSWTTVDANFAYSFGRTPGSDNGVLISLAIANLFDEEPPFAASPGLFNQGLSYDSTNASPIGRFVSLGLRKRF